jgi:hypothetical protein
MARPPLAMGTHGSISVTKPAGTRSWVARCRFRDFDGVTRSLERHGPTKTKALTGLQDEIRSLSLDALTTYTDLLTGGNFTVLET